jgi:lipopolysaccharide transport protein LptA
VCWRTEARACIGAGLLQRCALAWLLAAPATASPAALTAAPDQAPSPASAASAASSSGADREGCSEPMCYTASSLEAERTRMVLHDISIVDTTRGITRIKADLAVANGPDLGDSEWVLTGHVRVFLPEGKLNADQATVQFANKRIASMSAQGAPAEFEHSADAAAPNLSQGDAANRDRGAIDAHGHARQIDFDMEHNLLKLNGDAWLSDGCNEITSQSILYDIANQKVRADAAPGGDTQVQGTMSRSPQCAPAARRP